MFGNLYFREYYGTYAQAQEFVSVEKISPEFSAEIKKTKDSVSDRPLQNRYVSVIFAKSRKEMINLL